MPLRPLGLLRLLQRDRSPDKKITPCLNVQGAADVISAASSSTSQPVSREPQFHERQSDDLLTTGLTGRTSHNEAHTLNVDRVSGTAKNLGGKGSAQELYQAKETASDTAQAVRQDRSDLSDPEFRFSSAMSMQKLFLHKLH
jgi:hypothetical protein